MNKMELGKMYTCPMPEDSVFSDKPGNCPKCGMELVEVKNNEPEHHHHNEQEPGEKKIYTCPMPEDSVFSDKPGICPKCGMELVEVKSDNSQSVVKNSSPATGSSNQTTLPTNQYVISGLRPVVPQLASVSMNINTLGYVSYNPQKVKSIAARYGGRIERLYLKYNFQQVTKGQKIMDIYSPELATAQEEFLFMLSDQGKDDAMTQNAKKKLLLLGLTAQQLNTLEQTKQVKTVISVYAAESGHIHDMQGIQKIASHATAWPSPSQSNMENQTNTAGEQMSLREGDYVKTGDALFNIVNIHSLWILLKIHSSDIGRIKTGQKVTIYPEVPGVDPYEGEIDFIEPAFDNRNDFYTARVYLENCDHNHLKIGSLVKAGIATGNEKGLWIPKTSIVDLGNFRKAVFVKKEGIYKAIEITTGTATKLQLLVTSGLSATDSIAPVASYLVDSEAFVSVNNLQ